MEMLIEGPDLSWLDRLPAARAVRGKRERSRVAATYSRMSVANPTRIEDQQEAELRVIARLGLPLYDHYADDGASGTKRERRGWLRLKIDAALNLREEDRKACKRLGIPYEPPDGRVLPKFTDLVTFQGDRLARDHIDFQETVEAMLAKGIRVWDTVWGEVTQQLVGIIGIVARQEVLRTSVRTADGMAQTVKRGHKTGDKLFGYRHRMRTVIVDGHETLERDSGHYDPDPVQAPIYQECMRRMAAGEPEQAVHHWFNAECRRLGVTETVKGQQQIIQRSDHSFRRMLANPYYAGKVMGSVTRQSIVLGDGKQHQRPRKEWAICPVDHDAPLIDMQTWLAVQDRLARRARVGQVRRRPAQNPLSGLLHCGPCSEVRHVAGEKRPSVRLGPHYSDTKDGGRRGYTCRMCHLYRSESKMARVLQGALAQLPVDPGVDLVAVATAHDQQRAHLERELAAIEEGIRRCTRRKATLLMQRADAQDKTERADLEVALSMTEVEREALIADQTRLQSILDQVSSGTDLSAVGDHLARALLWTENREALSIEEARESLIFCIERVVLDGTTETATVVWGREVAALLGQSEIIMACPKGRNS